MAKILSSVELVRVAEAAGFSGPGPDDASLAEVMAAIALRESAGDPTAFNGNTKTGDQSYGLWQINMIGKWGPARRKLFGITINEDLFHPEVNARAAFKLYGGSLKNLSVAWYIDRVGTIYRDRYLKHLATVKEAMARGKARPPEVS